MKIKYKIPFALALLSTALLGCSTGAIKVEEAKPNPLPKLVQEQSSLVPVFSQSVTATSDQDALRLQLATQNDLVFVPDPKGKVLAYKNKQLVWENTVSKQGLTAGVEAGENIVVVGNSKGQLFALDQATGAQKWTAQLSGSILAPSLILSNQVITTSNDGTVYAHNAETGQQLWTYNLPTTAFSLRNAPAPVAADSRTVLVASANAYVYAIDILTGIPRMQRRVALSEGRSDVQRLNDIAGDPNVAGRLLLTTSYQGQVTALDLATQQVIWSNDFSSIKRPEIMGNGVFVAGADGQLIAYEITSGQTLWKNDQLLNRHLSNPVMLNDHLIVGDFDGYLHIIDPSSGQIIGRAKTNGEIRSLRVLDNKLYVMTQKGAASIWQGR